VKGEVKLRKAKATTLRRVLLARSCAMGGEDVWGEVKGVDEVGVRFACGGALSRGDRRSEIEVDPKRRGLGHGREGGVVAATSRDTITQHI
jgi:hypothetical protein